MRMKIILIVLVCLAYVQPTWAQCSACRATVESQIQNGEMTADGINKGILYLMVVPYLLMMGVGYILYRNYKKKTTSSL